VAELGGLHTADQAADWAHRSLPAKNTLAAADAELVETGFRRRLAAFGDGGPRDGLPQAMQGKTGAEGGPPSGSEAVAGPVRSHENTGACNVQPSGKTLRLRDKDHLTFVSKQACLVCGRQPSDAHHLRCAQPRALGRKVSDEFTVPVCRLHHRGSRADRRLIALDSSSGGLFTR
jgi:hypothetical protein